MQECSCYLKSCLDIDTGMLKNSRRNFREVSDEKLKIPFWWQDH